MLSDTCSEDKPDTLKKIYIEPTNACNLSCRTCIRNVWEDAGEGIMSGEVFASLLQGIADFGDVQTLAFAGFGEPLLHPGFADMVKQATSKGLRTEVTTNALLLTRELAQNMINAGIDQLVVSIDGTSAESFGDVRTGASLERVVKNVQQFSKLGETRSDSPPVIGIEFVAMRSNVHELPRLQHIAKRIGARFILISNVLIYAAELQEEALYHIKATASRGKETTLTPRWILPKMDFNDITQEPLSKIMRTQKHISFLDHDMEDRNSHCPFVNAGALAVSWKGDVSPCPPLLHSYTCYVPERQKKICAYTCGSLAEKSLREIWDEQGYVSFRKRVRTFDFPPCTDCGCELSKTNETDCYGNPFPVCGDCLWARGIIRCA